MDTVLVATDFSPCAENATAYALSLARFFGARLILTHVFQIVPAGPLSSAGAADLTLLRKGIEDRLVKEKIRLLSDGGSDPGISVVAEEGEVCEALARVSERSGANLVVVGMTGTGQGKGHLMGSTALAISAGLEVSTLIIPGTAKYAPIKRMTFACDYRFEEGSTVLQYVRALAHSLGAMLEVLNVTVGLGEKATVPQESQVFVEETLHNTDHVTILLHNDDVSDSLIRYFDTSDTDLVLLHPRRHNIFERLFSPGVSARVSGSVKVPVMLVK
jgi:nucleotide-binding universal stress UspA family protein